MHGKAKETNEILQQTYIYIQNINTNLNCFEIIFSFVTFLLGEKRIR